MSAKGWIGEYKAHKVSWTAAEHGAVATHVLGTLPDNFIIERVIARVIVAPVGGGSLVVGEDGGGDADGYFTDMDALSLASITRGTGALVNNSGEEVEFMVDATKDGVLATVATTLYSAGEIDFYFIGVQS